MPLATIALHFALSTGSAQARDDFERGMFLIYAYNRDAAYSAFADAARADPKFAMAYAGEALAEGPNLNQELEAGRFAAGKAAAKTAMGLRTNASDQERAYIEAIAKRYAGSWPNDATADALAYRQAILAIAERNPDDEDAQVLAAEALMEGGEHAWSGGRPTSGDDRRALSLVEGVLARDPGHVMANHLCIHLYDFATDRAPAVACAQTLDGDEFNPESEHLAHMPAHLWIETGDYTHALVSSQRAYELVTQLPEGDPHRAYYEPHDVYVGYSATMMRLDFDSALAWAKRLDAAIPKQGNAFEIETMLRFGHNEEAFGTAATAEAANEARAVAAIRLGNADAAKAIVAALGTREPGLATQARLDEARGNLADARADLQVLEKRQHDAYGGEMIPIVPAEEQLGGLELRAGNASRAERTFRDALARYPNDPWALFGLAAALDKEGETSGAAAVRAQLAGQGGDSSFMRIEDL